jgi:phospholipid/cholesterol/gamma-HCH transport system permease protein
MLTLPLLTIFIIYLALATGCLAGIAGGTTTLADYQTRVLKVLTLKDVVPAVLKTMGFGYLIGVSGCYAGMTAHGGTEGVGRAATAGVVVSIFLVLVSDVVLVRVIKLLS